MVAFDACVFSIAIFDEAGIPVDYRTGKPVERARERVDELIRSLQNDDDCILLPTPALGEALSSVAEHAEEYVEKIEQQHCFKIHPFGKREAIEIAVRTKEARANGDKKEGVDEPWQKMKYDRQIVASAKTEGATIIYSTDRHIHAHAGLWGIRAVHIADLPLPASSEVGQSEMFDPEDEGETAATDQSTAPPEVTPEAAPAAMPALTAEAVRANEAAPKDQQSIDTSSRETAEVANHSTSHAETNQQQADHTPEESNPAPPEEIRISSEAETGSKGKVEA